MTTPHGTASPAGHAPAGARPAALRLLVTGSRTWTDAETIANAISHVIEQRNPTDITIVHGACPRGADQIAAAYVENMADWYDNASKHLFEERHPADWDNCVPGCPDRPHRIRKRPDDIDHPGKLNTYCPGAGPRRNRLMVGLGADQCLAFILNGSSGATGCATLAENADIPMRPYRATTRQASGAPCPACSSAKAPRQYLCRGCWSTLQPAARRALNKHDALAARRLSELLEQLRNEVPLREIVITP